MRPSRRRTRQDSDDLDDSGPSQRKRIRQASESESDNSGSDEDPELTYRSERSQASPTQQSDEELVNYQFTQF